jgi:Holliday junction resolvase RusA-like endonuclease
MLQWRNYIASKYDGPKLSGPLLVICHFHIPSAKSVQKHKKTQLDGLPHWKTPDGDNLEKFLFDCCTRTLWVDDSQVSWIVRSKTYTKEEEGWTELYVTEIPTGPIDNEALMKTIWQNLKK